MYFLLLLSHLSCCCCFCLGEVMELSEAAEEAATFFAKMLDHDYTTKDVFCNNFFADWRKVTTQTSTPTFLSSLSLSLSVWAAGADPLPSECQWGVSYWCRSKEAARRCGRVEYCQTNVWKVSRIASKLCKTS